MRKRTGKHLELDVSTGWVKRSYVLLAFMLLIGSLSASVFVSNGSIAYVGADAIITFLRSGSITVVNQTIYNVSFLVVAGGGANGVSIASPGAGGGGGVIEVPSYTMAAGNFPVTVGVGGTTGNGGNSVFGSSTAVGGGLGSTWSGGVYFGNLCTGAASGGSGGGGGIGTNNNNPMLCGAASGTALQGYAGGAANLSKTTSGGGGGAGGIGSTGIQPNGGAGYCSSISGSSSCYGGGGGGVASGLGQIGGEGGMGGGGTGAIANSATGGTGSTTGSNGTNGTGGGGGGSYTSAGGLGGSGIVIVKMDASYFPLPSNATGYLDYCNGTNDSATSITWVGYDILTGNQTAYNINVDLQQVYNNTLLVENFTGAINDSSNFSLCMFPANGKAYAQLTDTLTYPSFFPIWVSHEPYTYSNSTKIYENYFLPYGNNSKLVQIFVVDNTYSPMTNVSVKIQQVSPVSGAIILLGTFLVDSFGGTTQGLQPATQIYHFSVLSANGSVLQDFANKAIPCSSSELVCSLVLVVNPSSLPIDITSLSGSCSYDSPTRVITCSGTDTSNTITLLNLTAFAIGATDGACSNATAASSGTLTCTLPNVNGTYNGYFFGTDAAGYNHLIDGGTYTVGIQPQVSYGRDGFLAVVMLVVIGATLMTGSIAVSMTMGVFAMFIGLAFGIVPLSLVSVAVLFAIVGFVISYRLKV